jgi:superfamily I DNA/RNA helicase
MTMELSAEQRAAVEAPLERSLAIAGGPATGKTTALLARIQRLRAERPGAHFVHAAHPRRLAAIAFDALRACGRSVRAIDDVDAELLFAESSQSLLSLNWEEIASGALDPEVPGLRAPERFLGSAFRLIRKLRDGAVEPQQFLERSLAGATEFYGKPPNFAHPDLIVATKERYRDSLDVTPQELERQYRREVDLAKILARLYERYAQLVTERGEMTSRDAIAEALVLLRETPALPAEMRAQRQFLFVDEAEELTPAACALLEAVYGDALPGVTLAGDPANVTSGFRGARPERAFKAAAETIRLTKEYRATPGTGSCKLELCRTTTQEEEADAIANAVRARLAEGIAPEEIALVFRCVADVHAYEAALLEHGVPAAVAGSVNVFTDRRVQDALALLWNVWDPFRHDWMLRSLSARAMALSDASLAVLCAEPPDPQVPLLSVDEEELSPQRARRWDPRRDLRLGWNVCNADQDASLGDVARERLTRFRAMRLRWVEAMHAQSFGDFIRLVWSEGLAREGAPGSARALAQQLALRRLYDRLLGYAREHPDWSIGEILLHAELRAASELESCELPEDGGFVWLLDVDAARGRSFAWVVVPDARAGSFPRWYAPDSFLFSPKLGMVPKDNVGDASAARTAKFSYYVHKSNAREAYNAEERRAFTYALRRARTGALVTASGRPTRGVAAPEFLQELATAPRG